MDRFYAEIDLMRDTNQIAIVASVSVVCTAVFAEIKQVKSLYYAVLGYIKLAEIKSQLGRSAEETI